MGSMRLLPYLSSSFTNRWSCYRIIQLSDLTEFEKILFYFEFCFLLTTIEYFPAYRHSDLPDFKNTQRQLCMSQAHSLISTVITWHILLETELKHWLIWRSSNRKTIDSARQARPVTQRSKGTLLSTASIAQARGMLYYSPLQWKIHRSRNMPSQQGEIHKSRSMNIQLILSYDSYHTTYLILYRNLSIYLKPRALHF
jgi:hypothetical protein